MSTFDFEAWVDKRTPDGSPWSIDEESDWHAKREIYREFRPLFEAAVACACGHHFTEGELGCPECALHQALRDLGVEP